MVDGEIALTSVVTWCRIGSCHQFDVAFALTVVVGVLKPDKSLRPR